MSKLNPKILIVSLVCIFVPDGVSKKGSGIYDLAEEMQIIFVLDWLIIIFFCLALVSTILMCSSVCIALTECLFVSELRSVPAKHNFSMDKQSSTYLTHFKGRLVHLAGAAFDWESDPDSVYIT